MKNRKRLIWIGTSKKDLLDLTEDVQRVIGYSLNLVQQGKEDPSSTIMKGFGSGKVREIIKYDDNGTYRAMYTVKYEEAIYVLHVFQKKSKKGIATPKQELDLVKVRLSEAQFIHDILKKEKLNEKAD